MLASVRQAVFLWALARLTIRPIGHQVESAIVVTQRGGKNATRWENLSILDRILSCQSMANDLPVYKILGVIDG